MAQESLITSEDRVPLSADAERAYRTLRELPHIRPLDPAGDAPRYYEAIAREVAEECAGSPCSYRYSLAHLWQASRGNPLVYDDGERLITFGCGRGGHSAIALCPLGSGSVECLGEIGARLASRGLPLAVRKVPAQQVRAYRSAGFSMARRGFDDVIPDQITDLEGFDLEGVGEGCRVLRNRVRQVRNRLEYVGNFAQLPREDRGTFRWNDPTVQDTDALHGSWFHSRQERNADPQYELEIWNCTDVGSRQLRDIDGLIRMWSVMKSARMSLNVRSVVEANTSITSGLRALRGFVYLAYRAHGMGKSHLAGFLLAEQMTPQDCAIALNLSDNSRMLCTKDQAQQLAETGRPPFGNGCPEFLAASCITHLRGQGLRFLNWGGSEEDAGAAFKRKFQPIIVGPEEETMSMAPGFGSAVRRRAIDRVSGECSVRAAQTIGL